MTELDDVLTEITKRGALRAEQVEALRKIPANAKMLRSAMDMFDAGITNVLLNMGAQALTITKTPSRVGGDKKMGKEQSTLEETPLTLEQLEAMLPAAVKEATEFVASPEWNPSQDEDRDGPTDQTIMFRVGRIHKGQYAEPLIVAKEFAIVTSMKPLTIGPVLDGFEGKKGLRIPTFAVRRAFTEKKLPLVEGAVYLMSFVGTKPTKYGEGKDFMQVAVLGPLPDFPKSK